MNEQLNRPSWDEIWIDAAHLMARRSYDPRLKVGCVIVPEDNSQILALGFNGNSKGLPNFPDSMQPGESNFIHAEQNSFYKLDCRAPGRKTLYVTHNPCLMCAKGAIQCNIQRVVYEINYRDLSGIELLKSVGVEVVRYER